MKSYCIWSQREKKVYEEVLHYNAACATRDSFSFLYFQRMRCLKSMSPCSLLGGQKLRVSESTAQLPTCPPHQHIMKDPDFAPYFNGWGRGMHIMEAVRVCVLVKGSPMEIFQPEWWSMHLSGFFFLWKKGGKRESKRDYSLLESGFWGTQAQGSVNLASLRGVARRGVLGGLIRRMLSHHPSRQAGENWLASCRVEFAGGGGGGWCGVLHWIPVTAFGLFQDLSSKLIKYPSCFSLPAVATLPLAAPSPSLHWPFDPSDYCERWGTQAASEWARVSGRNREKLQTQDWAESEPPLRSLLEDSSTSDRLTNDCPVSVRHSELRCMENGIGKQTNKKKSNWQSVLENFSSREWKRKILHSTLRIKFSSFILR